MQLLGTTTIMPLLRCCVALVLAASVAQRARRRRSLSASGAAVAFAVGALHLACSWTCGAVLLCFFLTSSKLTRVGQQQKAAADAHVKLGGHRTARQVLANSFGGVVACLMLASQPAGLQLQVQLATWAAFLGHYSCCCADTWSSELGMLSSRPPCLVTAPWRTVPAGVNGGVTMLGTAAGATGAACMAVAFTVAGWLSGELQPLAPLLHVACPGVPASLQALLFWLTVAVVCGIAGSLVDSVLGACVQVSGVHSASGRVVGCLGPGIKHVSGLPLLSNDAVNAASAALSSLAAAVLALALVRHDQLLC